MNYMQEFLKTSMVNMKEIPFDVMPTAFYIIKLEGWKNFSLTSQNPTFNNLMKIAGLNVKTIVSIYRKTHAFTWPSLSFNPTDSTIKITIGTLEIKRYNEIMKSIKN